MLGAAAQVVQEQKDVWEIEKFLEMRQIEVKTRNINLAAND